MEKIQVRSQIFFERLGELTRSTGKVDFYDRFARLTAQIAGCDRWLVIRYARYAMPEFIINNAMTDEAVSFYLQGLYRLDPLLRISREGPQSGVFSLSRLRASDNENAYFDDIFRSAVIYDELAMLFVAPGRVCVAVCLDRSSRTFSDQEVDVFQMLFPTLEAIHDCHIDKLIDPTKDAGKAIWNNKDQGIMILDRDHREIYANAVWREFEQQHGSKLSGKIHRNRKKGVISLDPETVLHWELLGEGFAIAPKGKICVVERRSAGYGAQDFNETIGLFSQKYNLSPREETIVSYALRGYPNSHIAKALSISSGTVRNHKYRLYTKLDITTERELYHMVITMLVGDTN